MTTQALGAAMRVEPLVLSDESTVVGLYESQRDADRGHQTEAQLEAVFIEQLRAQAYEYVTFGSQEALIANLRAQLESLNDYRFTNAEWTRFFNTAIATRTGRSRRDRGQDPAHPGGPRPGPRA